MPSIGGFEELDEHYIYFYFLWNVDSKSALMGKWQKCWERYGRFSAAPGNSQSVRLASLTVFSRSCHLPLSLSFPFLSYTYPYPQLSLSFSTWFNPKRQLLLPFLSHRHHFVLRFVLLWWDQSSMCARAQTHRWLQILNSKVTSRDENSVIAGLSHFRELVQGHIRRLWKYLSPKLKELCSFLAFVF